MNAMNVFRFLLALGLAPIVIGIGRRIRMPLARLPFVVGLAAIVVGLGMSAAQPVWDVQMLRTARHLVFAFGGFALAWAAWQARRTVLADTGADR
jgi:hypothetical protein